MKISHVSDLACPASHAALTPSDDAKQEGDELVSGSLVSPEGHAYPVTGGVPDLTYPFELPASDQQARDEYDAMADLYHVYAPLPFMTYGVDEWQVRETMVDLLNINADSKVLEVGCGSGRTSRLISDRLTAGTLHCQEIAPKILAKAIEHLDGAENTAFSLANGCYLSFPDRTFDASHHFGGLNTFSDIAGCLAELARVTKVGGRVVVGDEGMGPWIRGTEFGRVMMNSNPLLKCHPPMDMLPVCARDVQLNYIVSDAFYTIAFTVGDGEPTADYHLEIPSKRGGTHWSRYYGNLEGVSDEAKDLAQQARDKSGKSMHRWLDDVVRAAAQAELGQGDA